MAAICGNVLKICRTCLTENSEIEMENIFKTNLAKKLSEFTSIQVNLGDGLPDLICKKCVNRMNEANAFKMQAARSNETLKTILNSNNFSKNEKFTDNFQKFNDSHGGGNLSSDCNDDENATVDTNKVISRPATPPNSELPDQSLLLMSPTRNCPVCGEQFYKKRLLQLHKRTHRLQRKLFCAMCDKSFYGLYDLSIHNRIHRGEKPHSCTNCGKYFSDLVGLNDHMKIHMSIPAFNCTICNKSFARSSLQEKHMHTHTINRNYICLVCGKTFIYNHKLTQHIMRRHTAKTEEHPNFSGVTTVC